MTYAVTACGQCREPWAVDLRQATARCPRCKAQADLRSSRHLWQGDLPQEAQAAAAALRLGPGQAAAIERLSRPPARQLPRHDSATDAAAAQAAGIVNRSERAERVAEALTRLCGLAAHADLACALEKAGLDPKRAEAEIVRMLACDLLVEPRAGMYRSLAP